MFNLIDGEVFDATREPGLVPAERGFGLTEAVHVINEMHQMYSLPQNEYPTLKDSRIDSFIKIIQKEVDEGSDLKKLYYQWREQVELSDSCHGEGQELADKLWLDVMEAWADWLTDIIVYSLSELRRLGLDFSVTLPIVMASNFTKLGADGLPIKNPETGKVEKGPNFRPPEPTLREVIRQAVIKSGDVTEFSGDY